MNLYDQLLQHKEKLSVIGLGYVGLPIAVAFARKLGVIGYDENEKKIEQYQLGTDPTKEVGDIAVRDADIEFTTEASSLKEAKFHIIAVPTPVNDDHTPNLSFLKRACTVLGKNLKKGSAVVVEATVYPGVTEEICLPILEKESGMKCGTDFKIGYSPERLNPSDREHRLENVVKVVSGVDAEALETIAKVYELVVRAGVYRTENIKIAEAAKVIENCQRDINIAFMNELSIIFHRLGIDTKSVLEAAKTKWNFLDFHPGLVGGHCIGVDPYYLTYKAEKSGYHSQIILSGRQINDSMGKYIAENCVKCLAAVEKPLKDARILILGFTFKENCSDIRNTKVMDVVDELQEYGIAPTVWDPLADAAETKRLYGIELTKMEAISDMDAVILAVPHKEFLGIKPKDMDALLGTREKILFDIKGAFDRRIFEAAGYQYWSL